MLVLSFRDMSVKQCGAVTPAAIYDLDPMSANFPWVPAPAARLVEWIDVRPLLAGKHVCFVIHGFNVNRDDGTTGLGAFAQEFAGSGALAAMAPPLNLGIESVNLFIPVLWAGDWYLPINYPFLLPDIRLTAKYFADFAISADAQIARISFMTHSMGARLALEAMEHILAAIPGTGSATPAFGTVLLMAAAASDQVLDDPDYGAAIAAVVKDGRFVVVSSKADQVLKWDFPVGNLVENALWANDPGEDDALGRYGPVLRPDSPARAKTSWYALPLGVIPGDYDHGDYLPLPRTPTAPWPNGWNLKNSKIAALAQAVFMNTSPPWPPSNLA